MKNRSWNGTIFSISQFSKLNIHRAFLPQLYHDLGCYSQCFACKTSTGWTLSPPFLSPLRWLLVLQLCPSVPVCQMASLGMVELLLLFGWSWVGLFVSDDIKGEYFLRGEEEMVGPTHYLCVLYGEDACRRGSPPLSEWMLCLASQTRQSVGVLFRWIIIWFSKKFPCRWI